MRRLLISLSVLLLLLPLFGVDRATFFGTAVDVNASATKVNGTDFTSVEIWTARDESKDSAAIQITFTRTAGASDAVDFEFQVSLDGTNWDTTDTIKISVATNTTAVSNAVRKTTFINIPKGATHIRLYRIVNNDASNNVTACNATISL